MKKTAIKIISLVVVMFMSVTAFAQEKEIFTGTYVGSDANGYTFSFLAEDGENDSMTFPKIDKLLLKEFNLDTDKTLVGTKFEIMYTTESVIEEDEDGDEQEFDVYTIVSLKKVS